MAGLLNLMFLTRGRGQGLLVLFIPSSLLYCFLTSYCFLASSLLLNFLTSSWLLHCFFIAWQLFTLCTVDDFVLQESSEVWAVCLLPVILLCSTEGGWVAAQPSEGLCPVSMTTGQVSPNCPVGQPQMGWDCYVCWCVCVSVTVRYCIRLKLYYSNIECTS